MNLRIMTYNILFGGRASGPHDRTELILEVIRSVDPDVLVLQDASRFAPAEENRLQLYAERLGMRGELGLSRSGLHVAVLVRPQITLTVEAHDREQFRHCVMI